MRKNIHITMLWILIPTATGCSVAVPYVPNRPPVPQITHEGEFNVSGGIHGPSATGFDGQIVYTPWNHYSLYSAIQFDRGLDFPYQGTGDTSQYTNRFFEIGAGYYDSIRWFHYEVYLLGGLGSGSDQIRNFRYYSDYSSSKAYTDTTSLRVVRIGIQQNLAYGSDPGWSAGIGLGLGYERLYNIRRLMTNYDLAQTPHSSDSVVSAVSALETSPQSALYAEPLLFCSLGAPLSFNGTELFMLKCYMELWWTYRTNSYSSFGSSNLSLSLALDF